MKKILTLILALSSFVSFSQSLVISQVYGGGGNSGSVYKNDFVELFNPTGNPINVNDWSVQYNSSASTTTTWQKTKLPNVTILPGHYFLVQEAAGTAGTTDLPTPDVIGVFAMSGTAGKVVLVSDTNAIAIPCPSTNVIDKVGYGSASTCFEGTAPTTAPSNTNAVFRANAGCTDTNDNAADFSGAAAAPRNSASPAHSCGAVSPSLVATPTTLVSFGSIVVGATSASLSFNVSGSDLTGGSGNITITAPSSSFQVSNDNTTWGASTTIPYAAGTLASTTVYVRFSPQASGPLAGNVSINGGGIATAITVAVSGTGLAAVVPTLSASSLASFGNICANATGGPNSFTITGSNLTADNITVGPLAGYTFSTTATGTYAASLTLTQTGGTYTQDIFVNFTPTALQSYNGNIAVAGAGVVTPINVAATGSGANAGPGVTTGTATSITGFGAVLPASITSNGCTAITVYGIEYSTVNGFPGGTGIAVPATNLASGSYSVSVAGLLPSTTYYYKAYATNAGGTTYGTQLSFRTVACSGPTDTTGTATAITTNTAVVAGSVTDAGCTAVTAFGIQYSAVRTFANSFGIKVFSTAASSANYVVPVSNLVQNTKYYFRSFATNQGGTSYGEVDSFTTAKIPLAFTIYPNPVVRGGVLHYSIDSLYNGYYGVQLYTVAGQLLYQRNTTIQVGFIDDKFIVPAGLKAGTYVIKVTNNSGFTTQKLVLVY